MDDERSLHDVVSDLPDNYIDCRLGDHRWRLQGKPMREYGDSGLYVWRWRCPGCKAKRFDRTTSSGTLYGRWYERPKDYDIRGFGHATRRKAIYRQVLIERAEA